MNMVVQLKEWLMVTLLTLFWILGLTLGNVVVDGININEALIKNFLAVAYFGQSKDEVEAEHLVNREKLIELGKFTPVEV